MTSGLGSISSSHSTLPRSACSASTRRATSAPISGVSGAPAHSTSWAPAVDVAHRLEQVGDALLARDAPDEDDRRRVGIDAVAFEDVRAGVGRVLVGVDPVVDRRDAVGVDRRVGARAGRRASPRETATIASAASHRRALAERRQRVAAAELLGLPRTQRLERVDGHHVRDVVHELGQVAAEVRVPGVAVDEVGARPSPRPSSGRSTSRAARRAPAPGRPARPTPRDRWRPAGRRPRRARRRRSGCAARAPDTRRARRPRRTRPAGTRA